MRDKFVKIMVVIGAIFSAVGIAGAATPSYGTAFANADLAYVQGGLSEYLHSSASELTTPSYCVTIKDGYTQADIVLDNYAVLSPVNPSRIEMKVVKDSYTTSTGVFCWHAVGWYKSSDTTATNNYSWYFTIVLANSSTFSIRGKSYSCDGAGVWPDGSCDDTATFSSSITSGYNLVGVAVKGFDVSTDDGSFLSLSELGFDWSSATSTGTTVTVSDPLIRFSGDTSTNTAISSSFDLAVISDLSTSYGFRFLRTLTETNQSTYINSVVNYARPPSLSGTFGAMEGVDLVASTGSGTGLSLTSCGTFGSSFDASHLILNWGVSMAIPSGQVYSATCTANQVAIP